MADYAKIIRSRNKLGEVLMKMGWELNACKIYRNKPGNWLGVGNWKEKYWLVVGINEVGDKYSGLKYLIEKYGAPEYLVPNESGITWHIQDIQGKIIKQGKGLLKCDPQNGKEGEEGAYKNAVALANEILSALPAEEKEKKVISRIVKNWEETGVAAIEIDWNGHRLIMTAETVGVVLQKWGAIKLFYDMYKDK